MFVDFFNVTQIIMVMGGTSFGKQEIMLGKYGIFKHVQIWFIGFEKGLVN